jgi:soluble cytochrome b562
MKTTIRSSHILALLAPLILSLNAFAAGGRESPLHDEMEGINQDFRLVNRQYADPAQKASTLNFVADMQKHAQKARTFTPSKADKMSGADQANYIDAFHKDLDALIKEIGALQQAITADKLDVAKAEITKIGQLKDSSHKELGVNMGGGGKHRGPPPGQ